MELNAQIIESRWPLSEVSISKIKRSGGASVWEVVSKEGQYIAKIAHEWKTAEALNKDLTIFEFLKSKDFPHISSLLKTKSGDKLFSLDNKHIYLLEYVIGKVPDSSTETYGTLGEITGKLHNASGFPYQTDLDPALVVPDLIKNAEAYPFGDEYIEIVKTIPNFQSLSKALIHTDVSPPNSVQKPDGQILLIDWDDIGIGPAVMDIGAPLINQFITEDGKLKKEWLQAYYSRYFSQRKIPQEELPFIFDAGLFWACMYVKYGDTPKRWERIKWSVENRKMIEDLYSD